MQELKDRVNGFAQSVDERTQKSFKIKTLYRVIEETERHQENCEVCRAHVEQLSALVDKLESALKNHEERSDYLGDLKAMQQHFHKNHGFITEGYYTSLGISLGLCLGVALALSIFDNIAFMALGLPIGLGIGSSMDADAKKKGKVI